MFQGFKQFILKGNVVDLAVGVIIGASFNTVVTSLVKDLINPLLGVFGGIPDFSLLTFRINSSTFHLGSFLNTVLTFLINAAVVYFAIVLPMNKLIASSKKGKPVDPTTRKCPECLSLIPEQARRCAYCTTVLTPKKRD